MGKVFRIHEGSNQPQDWFNSQMITANQLQNISTDPKSEGKNLPTSIPSPFARLELVNSAFETVNNSRNENGNPLLDGNTDYHKLVSDTFDIGQIFFNYQKLADHIQILAWDPSEDLENLKKSSNPQHQHIGKTLDLFLRQDETTLNFQNLNRIFILVYDGQVIGGTSPLTVFAPAPDASQFQGKLMMGHDQLLDEKGLPLYERDREYIKFWFTLASQPGFADNFRKVADYLQKTKDLIQNHYPDLFFEINQIQPDDLESNYQNIPVNDSPTDIVEVNNSFPVKCQSIEDKKTRISKESDFTIASTKPAPYSYQPLFLPTERFEYPWQYTEDTWHPQTVVEQDPGTPIEERILPADGTQYPWLTGEDFLEENLIKLPYVIDDSKYLAFGSRQHLLPLTDVYFRFFNSDDIDQHIQMQDLAGGGVQVQLSIPLRNGETLTYKKIYHGSQILEYQVHLAICPFISNVETTYIAGLINEKYNLDFHAYNTRENLTPAKQNNRVRKPRGMKSQYHQVSGAYDAVKVQINEGEAEGYVIPKLQTYRQGDDKYRFAVDFGTTNTHIEYSVDSDKNARAFDIKASEKFLVSLQDKDASESRWQRDEKIIFKDMFPEVLNDQTLENFPTRCALTTSNTYDIHQQMEVFLDANISFYYEREHIAHSKALTNIKWSDYENPEKRKALNLYIKNILLLLYYKVLANNGNLHATEVRWFYPTTMSKAKRNTLQQTWKEMFQEVFGFEPQKHSLINIPESIPPYYYYRYNRNVLGLTVAIDIGGATSDISVYKENEPQFISSVKFGGEALYGDGYGGSPQNNGFFTRYKEKVDPILEKLSNDDRNTRQILENIIQNQNESVEFCNFLFSLSKRKDVNFDFLKELMNDAQLKLTYYIFYSALVYYIAKTMKGKGFALPEYILFSGSASKSLSVLDPDENKEESSRFFSHIFAEVYGQEEIPDMQVKLVSEPKKITSKGGLQNNIESERPRILNWLGGQKDYNMLISDQYDQSLPTYEDINDNVLNDVLSSITDYYQMSDRIFQQVRAEDTFGISGKAYEIFREEREKSLYNFLKEGILEKRKELEKKDNPIENTLFFYPLIGVLNRISYSTVTKS